MHYKHINKWQYLERQVEGDICKFVHRPLQKKTATGGLKTGLSIRVSMSNLIKELMNNWEKVSSYRRSGWSCRSLAVLGTGTGMRQRRALLFNSLKIQTHSVQTDCNCRVHMICIQHLWKHHAGTSGIFPSNKITIIKHSHHWRAHLRSLDQILDSQLSERLKAINWGHIAISVYLVPLTTDKLFHKNDCIKH